MRPHINFLSGALIERIVAEAKTILGDLGAEIASPEVSDLLLSAGAGRSPGSGRILLGEDLIDRALETVPGAFTLHDRHGAPRARLGGPEVHFTPGSSAIKLLDGLSGEARRPLTRDYIRYARLVDQLDGIDYQSTAFIPADVSEQVADSYRLYLSLVHGEGPVVTGAFGLEGLRVMVDLLAAVRGGEAALAAAPLAMFSCCPTAPLRWSREAAAGAVECARRRIPVEIIPMPLTGFVAPGTLVGTLVQHTAEMLSGIVISQSACPGAPVVWGGSPAVFDYRHESTPMGAVETQMIECACAEIGRSQGLPTQAYIGLSDSKSLDAQAGLETASGAVLAGLAGINSISGPGMLDFENSFSLEKLVLDDEICAMVKRLLGGIEVREGDFPSAPHFEELIRVGHLLISDHTRRWFREEVRLPGAVIDRTKGPGAGEGGARSLEERARNRVEQLLEKEGHPLDPDRRKDLDGIMSRAAAAAGMERLPAHDL